MAQFIHFDEAAAAAVEILRTWVDGHEDSEALLIADLFGRLRVVLFPAGDISAIGGSLQDRCGYWWTGDVLQFRDLDDATKRVFEDARSSAKPNEDQVRLRLIQRHRSRTAWFSRPVDPPWNAPTEGPPIVVFYSFKGGMGRSTLLAAFAIQRARAGEAVCVVDMDLDSPGIGGLLSADPQGLTAQWGVVDYMLEHRLPDVPLKDYLHRCDRVSGAGQIQVMPAGTLNEGFADKLGRIDLEEAPSAQESAVWSLLKQIRETISPDWILLDARTGISEPAGQLLSGVAHLHVLLGTTQQQSWQGLDRVLDRLGRDRVLADKSQAEVLIVQAMVPSGEPGKLAMEKFQGRSETTFEERYYVEEDDEDADTLWSVADQQSQDAPHVTWPIDYDVKLASFADILEVADALSVGQFAEIGARISGRFVSENPA